ncbi:hypothetical protein MRX96_022515 [Rhipicephalus microplus]
MRRTLRKGERRRGKEPRPPKVKVGRKTDGAGGRVRGRCKNGGESEQEEEESVASAPEQQDDSERETSHSDVLLVWTAPPEDVGETTKKVPALR